MTDDTKEGWAQWSNLVGRQVGLQKEMNLVRNEVQATNNIFNEILTRQQKYIDSQGG